MAQEKRKVKTDKLFNNPILEKISKTNSYLVIGVFIALSIIIFSYSIGTSQISIALQILLYFTGWLAFTANEYLMHRFLYHSGDDYKDTKNWQYKIHGTHHFFPRDKDRLAMPLILALVIASVFFGVFYLILGAYAISFFPGFIFGYACYLFVHNLVHRRPPPNNMFQYLWRHHHIHHHKFEDKAFGVTTQLWDVVFGTMPPKNLK